MKTFKYFLLMQFVFLSQSSFGMMRRFSSRTTSAAAPVASKLAHGKRLLLPGQEHNPAWIAANEEIEKFLKFYKMPKVPAKTIKLLEDYQDKKIVKMMEHYQKSLPPVSDDEALIVIKNNVVQKAKELMLLHGINPETISITFVTPAMIEKIFGEDTISMFVTGAGLFINQALMVTRSPEELRAELEHEISHLISHDPATKEAYSMFSKKDDSLFNNSYYELLLEKRADTHSSIQSKPNVDSLMNLNKKRSAIRGIGYDMQLKHHQITHFIKRLAPIMFESPEMIELLSRTYHSPLVFEEIKQIAINHYKARKIKAQTLQEIVSFCDRPTYLDDMLIFHDSQLPGFDSSILTRKRRPFWASAATGMRRPTEEKASQASDSDDFVAE